MILLNTYYIFSRKKSYIHMFYKGKNMYVKLLIFMFYLVKLKKLDIFLSNILPDLSLTLRLKISRRTIWKKMKLVYKWWNVHVSLCVSNLWVKMETLISLIAVFDKVLFMISILLKYSFSSMNLLSTNLHICFIIQNLILFLFLV